MSKVTEVKIVLPVFLPLKKKKMSSLLKIILFCLGAGALFSVLFGGRVSVFCFT